jgi:hypothetical protein
MTTKKQAGQIWEDLDGNKREILAIKGDYVILWNESTKEATVYISDSYHATTSYFLHKLIEPHEPHREPVLKAYLGADLKPDPYVYETVYGLLKPIRLIATGYTNKKYDLIEALHRGVTEVWLGYWNDGPKETNNV